LNFAFSRLPERSRRSFTADSLIFLEQDQSTGNEEDILGSTSDESIARATISLDVPMTIADVLALAARDGGHWQAYSTPRHCHARPPSPPTQVQLVPAPSSQMKHAPPS
jgi:hypothetical protein